MHKRNEYFIANDFTAIKMLSFIMEAFEKKQAPVSAEVVCRKLNLPADFGEKILDHLVKEEFLCRTNEPRTGFVPATDGNNITLADIADAIAKASYAQQDAETPSKLKAIMDAQHDVLAQNTLMQILDEDISVIDNKDDDQASHEQTES